MAVSRRLRFEILRRDSYSCRYCGAMAPDALTVDHVIPVTLGGGDDPNNLVTACQDCNNGKSSIPADAALVEDVDATAMLFAKAIERASEIRAAQMVETKAVIDNFGWYWSELGKGFPYGQPPNWAAAIERFISLGLTTMEFETFADKAFDAVQVPAHAVWNYFCGCCWREVTTRQDMARRLIEDSEV